MSVCLCVCVAVRLCMFSCLCFLYVCSCVICEFILDDGGDSLRVPSKAPKQRTNKGQSKSGSRAGSVNVRILLRQQQVTIDFSFAEKPQ